MLAGAVGRTGPAMNRSPVRFGVRADSGRVIDRWVVVDMDG
jgi:hypothetical protein